MEEPGQYTPEDTRKHLGQAAKLLAEAGWHPKNGVLTNAKGVELTAEFLLCSPTSSASCCPSRRRWSGWASSLRCALSIPLSISAATTPSTSTSSSRASPSRFRPATSSAISGARKPPTRRQPNLIGIKNPAIDKLVDRIILAKDREELVAATHALDRVLLWNHYLVPQWHMPFDRLARWDMFGVRQAAVARDLVPARVVV